MTSWLPVFLAFALGRRDREAADQLVDRETDTDVAFFRSIPRLVMA